MIDGVAVSSKHDRLLYDMPQTMQLDVQSRTHTILLFHTLILLWTILCFLQW